MLNGGSSSGKSSIARCLQNLLPGAWLTFGADTLVDAMPARLRAGGEGIGFDSGGAVVTGDEFRRLDHAWAQGVAAVVRAGVPVVVDEVFLGGPRSQARWRDALTGLEVLWVAVRCDPDIAAAREAARGDRETGMARLQAELVHRGVEYDLEVDTGGSGAEECARTIAARVTG
ncbi:chloramphenicol phosphotransferase CPT [Actinacidiphila acidipaludis]|uniref:Chloramphenicol phosphotransferase CPT n=1 Tax=Actinacidiphila acidipaludis TaxID=2873382 RepID=A0ABS7QBR9_9ACTN|nr:chloramphenicol phosphotransferase CPT [Streptomyces acidipaludis]